MAAERRQSLRSFIFVNTLYEVINMLTIRKENFRDDEINVILDGLVPENHLVRKIENAIDFSFIYDKNDFMTIAGEAFYIDDYDCSDYTFKVVFVDECDEDNDWYSIFLVREFWEFCENFMNKDEKENEENTNNKTTETKEETLSIQDIYKIITDSEGFEKIIEGMEDIGFTDETIYEVILNLVKRLN